MGQDYHFGVAPDIDHHARAFMRGCPEPFAESGPFEAPKTAREWATGRDAEVVEIVSSDRDTGKERRTHFARRQRPPEPVKWNKVSAPTFRSITRGRS